MLLQGDNIDVIKKLDNKMVDMIYLDPPFFTQKDQSLTSSKDNTSIYSFNDKWNSLDEYLEFMKVRLVECKRVLKDTGSIFLHCDRNASHYLRVLLDSIFGSNNFRSEIIWSYKRWSNSKNGLLNSHQNIYFYSKSERYKFKTQYTDYSPTTNVDQILQERARDKNGKCIYKTDDEGEIVLNSNKKGVPLSDVWEIPFLNPKAKERTGYPTQKPILLLERIIEISTDIGDVVLDPFCGSGTTLVAAKLLGRNFIGIDCSEDAIELTKSRLENPIKTTSNLLKSGKDAYNRKSEKELLILKSLNAIPVQRNSGIDGFLSYNYKNAPVAVKIQKDNETENEAKSKLIVSAKKKKCKLAILLITNKQIKDAQTQLYNNGISENIEVMVIESYDLVLKIIFMPKEKGIKESI